VKFVVRQLSATNSFLAREDIINYTEADLQARIKYVESKNVELEKLYL